MQMDEGGKKTIEKVIDRLHLMVAQLKEKEKHLELENIYLKERLAQEYAPDLVVGPNKQMNQIYGLISKVASTDSTVLLTGETGTGKGFLPGRFITIHRGQNSHLCL